MLNRILHHLDRLDVPVIRRPMPTGTPGATAWHDGHPVVYLDADLYGAELLEVATHELAHVLQGPPHSTCPRHLSRRELAVHERTIDILVEAAGIDEIAGRSLWEPIDLRHVIEAAMA